MKKLLPALLLTLPATLPAAENHQQIEFALPAQTERLLVLDLDRDGRQDVLAVLGSGEGLQVFFQRTDDSHPGFDFSAPDTTLVLPGSAVGWDVASPEEGDTPALLALVDGQRVLRWPLVQRRFGESEELISGLNGFLGQGLWQLNFSQDLNNDGLSDLVIPGAGVMHLLIANADGSFQPALSVQADIRQRVVLQPGNQLNREIGQSLRIPSLQLRDINGDGVADLISDTDTRLDIFLARAPGDSGDFFPPQPSFSIDREQIRERLGEFDVDQLDFSNLTGVLALTHEELLQDVNGDGIDDLILREGGRVALHLGQPGGMDLSQPAQILRSSGNVLSVFLADEDGDDRPDLWLWRVEEVSLTDVFMWLAVSGTINIEAFVYPNEGQQFARRPSRRINVAVRFPSAVRLISSVQQARERAGASEPVIPLARARLQAETTAAAGMDDALVLLDRQLEIFLDALPSAAAADEDRFLASLGYQRARNDYEIDLRSVIDAFSVETNREVRQLRTRPAQISLELAQAATLGHIEVMDLDGDALDDVFVFIHRDRESVRGMLLLSR